VAPEIVVVDSGSRDASLDIARRWADRTVEIRPEEFTYGRALNLGAEAASAPVLFALSAHCFPEREDWIERSLSHFGDPRVAGATGVRDLPDRTLLRRPFRQDLAHAEAHPRWGFTNHASSWRAEVWRSFPFDEELDYAEDKEWALRVLRAGYLLVFDPDLYVDMSHMWRTGLRSYYIREKRAAAALDRFAPLGPYRAGDLLREWWTDIPQDRHSALAHRFLNYRRLAGLTGKYIGHRAKRRSPGRP
jgi:rhamnosyltransferase